MTTAIITSVDNPLVKRLARLAERKGREEDGCFLAEGRRIIDGFLAAGMRPQHLLLREGETPPPGWPVATVISARVADRLTQGTTASGYVAAFPIPVPSPLDPALGGLVLAEVGDPGNVGTLIRSAAAFAIRQLVLVGGADPWSGKVVQASAGALAAVALHRLPTAGGLAQLADQPGCAPLTALVVRDGMSPAQLLSGPRFLVVGGEANGIPEAWMPACRERMTLPMPGGTESLNAAVAGSIAAYLLHAPGR